MNLRGWKQSDLKVKTAAAATAMNTILTAIKFLLYLFSGSMAILAEAWHSFSDIATSLLVFIAIRRSSVKAQEVKEGIPAKYNTNSQLSYEVTSGSNTYDIPITTQ